MFSCAKAVPKPKPPETMPSPTLFVTEALSFGKDIAVVLKETAFLGFCHPFKSYDVARAAWKFQEIYFSIQKQTAGTAPYFAYSESDHQIPFRPEESVNYNRLFSLLMLMIKEGIQRLPRAEFQPIVDCFSTANKLAQEVYQNYQTIMPRFTVHQQWGLHLVQWIDLPVNCCPSLHVAFSSLMYNLKESLIPRSQQAEAKHTLERMAASVLYTKQHALIDVAFGFLCAKMAYEQHFGLLEREILNCSERLQAESPSIPYSVINEIYSWSKEEYLHGKPLVQIVGEYLQEKEFPTVSLDEDLRGIYFDTKEKILVNNK